MHARSIDEYAFGRRLTILLAVVLGATLSCPAQGRTSGGPHRGDVYALAINSATPSTLSGLS